MKLHKYLKPETNDNLKKGFTFDMYVLTSYGSRQMQFSPKKKNLI
jgi:hypothetical protein